MRLRILHTESSWGWGGQELRILTESVALISRGHAVAIAAPADTPLLRAAVERGIEAIALPIRKKRLGGLLAIRRLLLSRKFDVVNTHSSTDSWLTALACVTLSHPPRIVRTRHVSTPVKASPANRWLFGRACAAVVTTGEVVREMLIRDLRLDPENVISVPTGVDSNAFHPVTAERKSHLRQSLHLPQDRVIIGTVATLRFLKGIEYLFQAFHLLRDQSLMLCVVGDGPQRSRLESLIVEYGMQEQIKMVGEQTNVSEWLQCFDIFAFPSLAEGVPQALAQAMLTELPCVTTNVGGIPELAIHEKTAWVCEPRDPQAIAEGINRLRFAPSNYEHMGGNARTHCISSRSIDHMTNMMEFVFRRLAGSTPSLMPDGRRPN